MRLFTLLLLGAASIYVTGAFQVSPAGRKSSLPIFAEPRSSFLDKLPALPDLFGALKPPSVSELLSSNTHFVPTPTGLIQQAGRVIAADLGLLDPSLLDSAIFQWIGPTLDRPLSKTEYLAAGRFFSLRTAFPDYDYRAHDFRIDENDDKTVRLTIRVSGSMRGELRLRDEVLPPTGKTMRCPPEAVSMTFDPATGKVTKLCTGFSMDRLVGNTAGCTGARAAAVIAGKSPSDWELYPSTVVAQRIFDRPVPQLKEEGSFLAPFPETVMIQLVKGILATSMAAEDQTLLSDDFTYCTPYQGPVRRKTYLEQFAKQDFQGLNPSFSHFRIDPYDPVRVWVDVVPTAAGFEGPPQAMSFTFDEDGFCKRITSGAVMDPTIGNAGGLGGVEGFKYATGQASPGIATRPLPQVLGRVRKRVLGLISGVDVDEYLLPDQSPPVNKALRSRTPLPSPPPPPLAPKKPSAVPPKTSSSTLRTESNAASKSASVSIQPKEDTAEIKRKQEALWKEKEDKELKIAEAVADKRRAQEEAQISQQNAKQTEAERQEKAAEAKRVAQLEAKKATTSTQQLQVKRSFQAQEDARKKQKEASAAQRQKEEKVRQVLQAQENARTKQEEVTKTAQKQQELKAKQALQAKEGARKDREEAQQAAVEQKRMEAQAQSRRAAAAKQRNLDEQKKLAREKARRAMMEAEEKRKQAEVKMIAQERARKEKLLSRQADQEKRKRESEERRIAQIAARLQQEDDKKAALEEKKAATDRKRKEKAALDSLATAASRATIALFGFGGDSEDEKDAPSSVPRKAAPRDVSTSTKKAPRNVPVIAKWRKKIDGSVTGLISGSKSFADGERVTTSPIVKGKIESGEVVTTGSGSRYFLS